MEAELIFEVSFQTVILVFIYILYIRNAVQIFKTKPYTEDL
jgi:uncharacterized membrane protein YobD (UPF0266 family)